MAGQRQGDSGIDSGTNGANPASFRGIGGERAELNFALSQISNAKPRCKNRGAHSSTGTLRAGLPAEIPASGIYGGCRDLQVFLWVDLWVLMGVYMGVRARCSRPPTSRLHPKCSRSSPRSMSSKERGARWEPS